VYVGFKTILDAGTDTKKLLASILVGALLVNFSLFVSKLVIDVANITAIEIYQQMGISDSDASGTAAQSINIAERFMARMGILSLVSVSSVSTKLVAESSGKNISDVDGWLMFVIGAVLIILVASFVFAAGAILLAIRFGVLVFLMILSPVAFIASVFPGISGWSSMWWRALFNQALFAPAYLFLLYLTLVVADGYQSQMRGFDKIFSNQQGVFQEGFTTAAFFSLTIVMMMASLIIAKKIGTIGTNFATRSAGKLTAGAGAMLGRQTFGRLGYLGSNSESLKEAASKGGASGWLARRTLNLSRGAAAASYDARGISSNIKLAGQEIDLGKPQKGGYQKRREDITKKEQEYAKSLGTIDDEKDSGVLARKNAVKTAEDSLNTSKDEKHTGAVIREKEETLRKARRAEQEEKDRRQFAYAGRLENSGWLKSFFDLRTADENKEAGEAIRKQYVKKAKQEKADAQTAQLVDAVEGIKVGDKND